MKNIPTYQTAFNQIARLLPVPNDYSLTKTGNLSLADKAPQGTYVFLSENILLSLQTLAKQKPDQAFSLEEVAEQAHA